MSSIFKRARATMAAAGVVLIAATVGGCGGFDGVELNGKIFEAMGVSGDSFGKKAEPRTQARAPLVLPPDQTRLPEPGAPKAVGAPIETASINNNAAAWPKDREALRTADAEAKKREQEKFCKENGNWREKAVGDPVEANQGPHGKCQGNIFSIMGGSLFGSDKE